jgi:serine/threonine protein kinase
LLRFTGWKNRTALARWSWTVEGPTLAERIKRGSLPIEEALLVAKQIADGLEYAHERGIIHRDLKLSNVKQRPNGQVKILDSDFKLFQSNQRAGAYYELVVMSSIAASASPINLLIIQSIAADHGKIHLYERANTSFHQALDIAIILSQLRQVMRQIGPEILPVRTALARL